MDQVLDVIPQCTVRILYQVFTYSNIKIMDASVYVSRSRLVRSFIRSFMHIIRHIMKSLNPSNLINPPTNASRLPKSNLNASKCNTSRSVCSNSVLVFNSFPVPFYDFVSLLLQCLFQSVSNALLLHCLSAQSTLIPSLQGCKRKHP